MSFRSLLVQSATITRAGTDSFDDYGNPIEEWETLAAGVPCRINENPSTETVTDRETVERTALGFFEAGTDLTAYDRATIDGVTWEIAGNPVTRTGASIAHHIEANLREVTP